jgi:hypothetical protein
MLGCGAIAAQGGRVVTVGPTAVELPGRWRQWLRQILLAVSALLVVAAVVGVLDPRGLLTVRRVLDHPFLFGATALSLLVAAGGLRRPPFRPWVAALLMVTALWWLMGLFVAAAGPLLSPFSALDGSRVVNRMPAPQGKPYRAIMIQPNDYSGPHETVLIQSGHGAKTRQWVAACEGLYELKTASWVGPGQLTITLQDDFDKHRDGEMFVIRVDPDSGPPQPLTDSDLHCL